MPRITGLDSIRFVCALFVVFWHLGFLVPNLSARFGVQTGEFLAHTIAWLFNGPAAVIVFFVISGFCIHLPYSDKKSLDLLPYYSKRAIRICLPALAAIGVYYYLKSPLLYPQYGVFWSILCELVYYALYPLILALRRNLSWGKLITVAYAVSVIAVILNIDRVQNDLAYFALGLFTWIVGLPCWLLGCWLAENYSRFALLSTPRLWLVRIVILVAPALWTMDQFYFHLLFPGEVSAIVMLNVFALIACAWIGFEIVYYQHHTPAGILEKAGRWSYSLYMLHPVIPAIIIGLGLGGLPQFKLRVLNLLLSLIFSYIFFLLIEKPAHRLAIYVSQRLKKTPVPDVVNKW